MRFIKPLGALAACLLITSCFLPWIELPAREIVVTGMNPGVTRFGKPGMLHLVFTAFYLLLLFLPHVWSRRVNLGIAAFNVAWAFRNFALVSACYAGECPEKQAGLYLVVASGIVMIAVVLLAPEDRKMHA